MPTMPSDGYGEHERGDRDDRKQVAERSPSEEPVVAGADE